MTCMPRIYYRQTTYVRVASSAVSGASAAEACSGSRRAASVVLVGAPGPGRKLSTREIVFRHHYAGEQKQQQQRSAESSLSLHGR